MLVPTNVRTNMAAIKSQKHLPLSFAVETKHYYSRAPTH